MTFLAVLILPAVVHHPDYAQSENDLRQLLTEDHLWTVLFGVLILCLVVSAYRKLKSISPVLVPFTLLLIIFIMLATWTQTRTEPKFLSPLINILAHYVPQSTTANPPDDVSHSHPKKHS